MMMQRYKVVSLFSGAMGLDIGLERTSRFEVVACVEKEKSFAETIEANAKAGRVLGQPVIFHRDITLLEPSELMAAVGLKPGELDLLVGGPPCQSFSTAGKRGTVQDHRGTLLWQYLRFVEALRPKFFLMENVRGLLSAALRHRPIAERPEKGGPPLEQDEQPGSVVRAFAEDMQRIEGATYHMDCFEVNAVNYGAPQLRERALFIGNRFNAVVEFAAPTHAAPNNAPAIETLSLFSDNAVNALPWKTLGDALKGLQEQNPTIMDFSPRKKRYLAMVPPGSNWRSLPLEIQKESMGKAWFAKGGRSGWWRRLTFDLPSPTLVTMPNHAGTALCHPTETRALTLREYVRIQEFPDDWQICGTPAEQYAQVGNAVPVRLGEVAAKVIAPQLDALAKRGCEPYSATPSAYRIVYVQSHVRTRQWFKDGKTLVWQDGDAEDGANPSYGAPKTKRRSKVLIGA
ncbi:MAG: DNA cytosine methyltransferase [Verrucomicrobiia bacterium]|jgi:DNA (cytosine-5)-methyltransferase 1